MSPDARNDASSLTWSKREGIIKRSSKGLKMTQKVSKNVRGQTRLCAQRTYMYIYISLRAYGDWDVVHQLAVCSTCVSASAGTTADDNRDCNRNTFK